MRTIVDRSVGKEAQMMPTLSYKLCQRNISQIELPHSFNSMSVCSAHILARTSTTDSTATDPLSLAMSLDAETTWRACRRAMEIPTATAPSPNTSISSNLCRRGRRRLLNTGMGRINVAISVAKMMPKFEYQTALRFKQWPGMDRFQNDDIGRHRKTVMPTLMIVEVVMMPMRQKLIMRMALSEKKRR